MSFTIACACLFAVAVAVGRNKRGQWTLTGRVLDYRLNFLNPFRSRAHLPFARVAESVTKRRRLDGRPTILTLVAAENEAHAYLITHLTWQTEW